MASLEQLVGSPTVGPSLSYLAQARSTTLVTSVALVEDVSELERVPRHAIVLLTRAASALAGSYRLDVALRIAASIGVAALVLCGPAADAVTPTAGALAERLGVALLGADAGVDLAALAIAIGRELSGGADAALLRAHTAMRAIHAHPPGGAPEAIAARAGAALGVPIRLVSRRPSAGVMAAVRGQGQPEWWLTAERQEGDLGLALELTLSIASTQTWQALEHTRLAASLPLQSRGAILAELLVAPPIAHDAIAHRARALGVPIDGWHVAARLDFEDLAPEEQPDPIAADQARQRLAASAIHALREAGAEWHTARSGAGAVLVRTSASDPGPASATQVARALERTMSPLREVLPLTLVHCGVGGAHQGPSGLLASASEAKAAVAVARTSKRPWSAVAFDRAGLRRGLVEWYTSDTARDAVATVLAPLVGLGGARAERLIRTLHVYLDEQGSLTRTGEVLNLHRNTVAYRVEQIFALLDVDEDNPDDRLLLQLACRGRDLTS
ncbi:PucR family transcriptional regulator [Conexibacter woesei]|uniref:PucR family transcriptional regulator n=1 Tax=Conexibacter woesei TaxID=191495 RepID=UPI0003F4FEE9|nr:helix-turn-helix domain-containing protein [Conexibacter woesei]